MIKYLTFFVFVTFCFSHAQSKKEETLRRIQNDPFIEAEKINDKNGEEIYKIKRLPSGKTTYKNFSDYKTGALTKGKGVDTTKIYLQDIDTTRFQGMYEYWMITDIVIPAELTLKIEDFNKNNLPEIYGGHFDTKPYIDIKDFGIFEYDSTAGNFIKKYVYQPFGIENYYNPAAIYDIDGDGLKDYYMIGVDPWDPEGWMYYGRCFNNLTESRLPTQMSFQFRELQQINDSEFGDFNGNQLTDYVYFRDGLPDVKIGEYDPVLNNLDTNYVFDLFPIAVFGAGFATDDVDGDGYADLTFGTIDGDVLIFEFDPAIEDYRVSFQGKVSTYNAYLHFNTDDIDKNGKKEFWVGGDMFYGNDEITRITCFEADGNDEYSPVHVIDIHGIFSFMASNVFTVDVDKDKTEEIGLCLDQTFYIFKFTGEPDRPSYNLYYYNYNAIVETDSFYSYYSSATMHDLDNDGYEELLISSFRN